MAKTAYPISSTPRTERSRQRAFTLVELMVSTTLASFLMLGVLSSFLMMGRSGANAQNYTQLESKARRALEYFSREARLAYAITSYSSTSVTLSIPDTSSSRTAFAYSVTYTFDSTAGTFSRTGPPIDSPAGTSATTVLLTGVTQNGSTNPFNYYRYVTTGYASGFTSNTASNTTEIKQIEINFILKSTSTTVTSATNKVLSARFILRNK
ncbi:MAG TPA: prepilin-type N-terminal cleavage/methylation domain-containing protein [Rariglobus sp.]|jgi:prepilin-type N-terminal cleavage/methylation domain-containing protein|nr:prepilin-type N-terminal cleavage/methylation domain-containing protein [Rariglobus sp.]